jgi:hypothetical protein
MFRCLLLLVVLLVWGATGCEYNEDAEPDIVVSFFATVSPDSRETTFGAAMIGTEQATSEDINELIRPAGGKVLIVTSITGYHITPSSKYPFSVVGLIGITDEGSTRGWGNGGLSIAGLHTTHVTFKPGLAVTLTSNESLCIASFIQSNDKARVGVHGYLRDRQ